MGDRDLAYVKIAQEWKFDLLKHENASEALFVKGHRATTEKRKYNKTWTQIGSPVYDAG